MTMVVKRKLFRVDSGLPLASKTHLLATREVAELFGVHKDTVKAWRMRRSGPRYIKFSRRLVRYRLIDVENFLERQAMEPEGK